SRRQILHAVGAVGLAAVAGGGRLPWQAQPPAKVPRIGYLATGTPGPDAHTGEVQQGPPEEGYADGENIVVVYRHGTGRLDDLPDLAAELVRLPVDLLVATTTPAIRAAKEATSTIPIVMTYSSDPVANGFVTSLGRPGG